MKNPPLQHRIAVFSAFFVLLVTPVSRAVDCKPCDALSKKHSELLVEKERISRLLGKNRSYLSVLSSSQASKFLKVESNIAMILKDLDRIKAEIAQIEKDYLKQNCAQCSGELKNETESTQTQKPSH